MKRITAVVLMFLLAGCLLTAEAISIVTVSFPCYDLARAVAGDKAEIKMLIRPGEEVHAYEPTPTDILELQEADLFVYIGGESDEWVDGILENLGDDAPAAVRLIDSVEAVPEEEEDGPGTEWDEHIWTSPKNERLMLAMLTEQMCEAYPDDSSFFRNNASVYGEEIDRIESELIQIIENASRRVIIFADRFPFIYMAKDYGLDYKAAIMSCTAEAEPSASKMIEIIDEVRNAGLSTVYVIELSTGNIARTISEETGASVEQLHSIQTVTRNEYEQGETWVSLMQQNLEALRKGLL